MKKTGKTFAALMLALLLAVSFAACGKTENPSETQTNAQGTASETDQTEPEQDGLWKNAVYTEDTQFGSGSKTVAVEVKAGEKSVTLTLKTDKDNLCDALLEHALIDGDNSGISYYVKTVNGMLADYDIDQSYWGFFKNGEMQMVGVDGTTIADGEHYELVYTK